MAEAHDERRGVAGPRPDPARVTVVAATDPRADRAATLAGLVEPLLAEDSTVLVTGPSDDGLTALLGRLPAEVRAQARVVAAVPATIDRGDQRRDPVDAAPMAWGYAATDDEVVRLVAADRGRFGWVPLPVHGEPALTAAEMSRLLLLHTQQTPARERRGHQAFPDEMTVPTPEQVRDLADRLGSFPLAAQQIDPRLRDALDRDDVEAVLQAFAEVDEQLTAVLERRRPWVVRVADQALAHTDDDVWERVERYTAYVEEAGVAEHELGETEIEGLDDVDEEGHRAITALAERTRPGEELRRRFRSRAQRAAARWLDDVRVDDEPVTEASQLHAVRAHLAVYAHARALEQELAPLGVPVPTTGPRPALVAGLVGVGEALEAVARLVDAVRRLVEVLGSGPAGVPVDLRSLDEVDRIRWTGHALGGARVAGQGRAELEALAARLATEAGREVAAGPAREPAPEIAELAACLRAADAEAYSDWLRRLDEGRREHRLARMREDLHGRLAAAAPRLAALLATDPADELWSQRLAVWPEAWAWARAATWLARQLGQPLDEGDEPQEPGEVEEVQQPEGPTRVDPRTAPLWLLPLAALPTALLPGSDGSGVSDGPDRFDVLVVDAASQVGPDGVDLLGAATRVVALDDGGAAPPGGFLEMLRAALEPASQSEGGPDPAEDPRAVVLRLAATGFISGADVRAATGLSAGRTRRLLQQLVDEGELTRSGRTSATRYRRVVRD